MEIGLSIEEYNEMTPYELLLAIKAFEKKLRYEEEQRIIQAYLTAYWQRVERLKPLKKILAELSQSDKTAVKKKQMSSEEMLKVVTALNAQFGGEVIGE